VVFLFPLFLLSFCHLQAELGPVLTRYRDLLRSFTSRRSGAHLYLDASFFGSIRHPTQSSMRKCHVSEDGLTHSHISMP
jgi:hypothetical protein